MTDDDRKQPLIAFLQTQVTAHKQALMTRVLSNRTRHITVAVENLFQPHNASAVLRSCDCFGVQDVHIVENRNRYRLNRDISLGASKWLSLHKYDKSTLPPLAACLSNLRERGYRIAATTLRPGSIPLAEVPVDEKLALFFGAEMAGLSPEVYEHADLYVQIPMVGFTQSLNVSVSAALCLHELTGRLRQSDVRWQLSEGEQIDLTIEWLVRTATKGELLARHFLRQQGWPADLLDQWRIPVLPEAPTPRPGSD